MQPKGKHARPQDRGSVKQLSKIASTVNTLYHPSGVLLYLWYIHCTTHCGGFDYHCSGYNLSLLSQINCPREAMWHSSCFHNLDGGSVWDRNFVVISWNLLIWVSVRYTFYSDGVQEHSKILSPLGWFEVWLFPNDNNPRSWHSWIRRCQCFNWSVKKSAMTSQ